ncbi:hypothetical protein Dxin01_01327 [Deinococcus xinjiangensis]|uniref:HEAT repeat domain-containing protein n=1 Tax=Deinococcus xinjiangensis TaxID=457454 RepID=A0ABP9VAF5_9DEIO
MSDEIEVSELEDDQPEQAQTQEAGAWLPIAHRLPRKLPSARQLNKKIWLAVLCAADLLDHHDPAVRMKAIHALSAASGQYLKGLEVGDIQKRIEAIEAALKKEGEAG